MYSEKKSLEKAGAPYLLGVVGWLLLTVLGQKAKIEQDWGIDIPAMTLGVGVTFMCISMVAIFLGFSK